MRPFIRENMQSNYEPKSFYIS
uniref:Uncharacterized protein n=1 Tax=Arundo donax TaxID=35708 RepID=A0A0A9HGL2_ARUDO